MWTPKMDAKMLELASAGFTSRKIAEAINQQFQLPYEITRNAVIGRANRIGLSWDAMPRIKKAPKPKRKSTKKIILKPANVYIGNFMETGDSPPADGLTIWELGLNNCRWTESSGHPSNYVFCGHRTRAGSSYCQEHHTRVYYNPKRGQ